jgi:signal transduction histidine kinase
MEAKYQKLQKKIDKLFGIAARREMELNAIREIGRALSKTLDRDKLFPQIMSEVTRLMDADRGTLYLYDVEKRVLWSKVLLGDGLKEIRLEKGQGIAGWVAENIQTVNIIDAYDDERFNPAFDKKSGYRTKSILCMPIMDPEYSDDKHIIGVIQILNKKGGYFTRNDEFLLEVISSQVAISLKNSQFYNQVREQAADLNLLYNVEKLFSAAGSLEDIFDKVIELISSTLKAEAGSILLKNHDKRALYFKASFGERSSQLKHIIMPEGSGIVGWVVENETSIIVNNPWEDSRFNPEISRKINYETKNIICVPLISGSSTLGAIEIINKNDGGFDDGDLRLLEMISGNLARAIENLNYRVQQSREDRLTTLGNLMSTVLHDLRTPVNNIHGFVGLLNDPNTTQEERAEFIDIINSQINSVLSMISEILDFAKGKTTILPRKTGAGQFFQRLTNSLKYIIEKGNHELVIEEPPPLWLYIDPERMLRVVTNLVKNSVEAMKEPGKIEISLRHPDGEDWVILYVSDNGPGIPPEIKNNLFDSFSTSGKEHGTGLGLAIVKKIVEEHGGLVDFTTSDKGTTFTISIPLAED